MSDEQEVTDSLNATARAELSRYIDRVEKIEEQLRELGDDRKLVYAEAKATGFDTKALRRVIRLRRIDKARRDEEEALIELYLDATGG